MLFRHNSCSDLTLEASGDADVEIMGTRVELGSFLSFPHWWTPRTFGNGCSFKPALHGYSRSKEFEGRDPVSTVSPFDSTFRDAQAAKPSCLSSGLLYRLKSFKRPF